MENSERLIYIDDLTGLYNRRYLYSHLPKELQAAQTQNYSLWLFMLDIDNFKIINDTHGHLCGDEVLKEIAQIIKQNTKTDDKKIRYAGDEFTIILPALEAKNVVSVAERLLTKISTHIFKEKRTGKEVKITMSLGAAGYPQDTSDSIELINLADKSLYISKQKGKNCVSAASEITPELFWKKDLLDRFPCSVLIERDSELLRLKDVLRKAFQPQAQLLLVSGELGVGKTRLVSEFGNIISDSGRAICLIGRGQEKFLTQPYYLMGEVLHKYLSGLDKLPEGILEGFSEEELAALINFMPIIKNIPGLPPLKDLPTQEDISLSPYTSIKLWQNIALIKPLCILFDDFHYVDTQTLEVILNLTQQNREFPIFILATYTPQDITTTEMASSVFASAMNTEILQKSSETLNLDSLSLEGVGGMIANIFSPAGLTTDFVDLVYKITKGNPLFVQELLKYLIEKEHIIYAKGKWIQKQIKESDLPLSIEDAIKRRIDDLDVETREMITKAAAIGDDFQVDLLQKIDSEDKGYVLDLITAAKKIGLVYERGAAGRDEFSFVTGEIRKVIFNLIDESQKKHLHSRLGQIQEDLYAGNLSSIAGELYYNFKKAEDWARAEQYAKLIKESKATFYDRTVKYAESLLEAAEEEKRTVPLSKKALAIMPQIIRYNYIASVNYVLYPPQSKMRLQPVEEIHKRLLQIFSETDVLTIASFQDILIVNNKRLGKEQKSFFVDGFISLLKNLNIESISFEKGVEIKELSKFIEIINNPQKDEALSLALENSGVSHIKINEISFDTTKKKLREKESLQEMMLIDYLLGKLPADGKTTDLTQNISAHTEELNEALEKLGEQVSRESGKDKESAKAELMAKSIQKIGSQFIKKGSDGWLKYKEGLAKTILSMNPDLRADILVHRSESADKEDVDVIRELIPDIPDDTIIDVLTRQYLEKDTDFERMKKLVERFLSTPEKKNRLIPILREKLIQLGASKEECAWMLEEDAWNKLSCEEKAAKIITMPIKNLFRALSMMQVDSLIEGLLSEKKDALAEAVLERLFGLLGKEYPQSQPLAGYFSKILDTLIQGSTQKIFPKFIQRLIGVSSDKKEFFSLVINPYLDKIIKILLESERFTLLKALIQFYTEDADIMERFSQMFEPIIFKLIKEFIRRIDANLDWAELADILVLFGDKVVPPLIEEALFEKGVESGKYFEAYLRRCMIGKILSRLPKESFLSLLREKFSAQETYIIKNLIELIRVMEDEEVVRILEIPLKHKDNLVRRKTIFALSKIKGKASAELLGEALSDTDISLRKYALNILKNRKDDLASRIVSQQGQGKDLL